MKTRTIIHITAGISSALIIGSFVVDFILVELSVEWVIAAAMGHLLVLSTVLFISRTAVTQLCMTSDKMLTRVRTLARGGGDLTIRVFDKNVDCSAVKNCKNRDCRMFGKRANTCMIEVGSYAEYVGNQVECPSVINGAVVDCMDCDVMHHLMPREVDKLASAIDMFTEKIRNMVMNVLSHADVVYRSSEFILETSEAFSIMTANNSDTIHAMSDTIKMEADTSEKVLSVMKEMNDLVDTVYTRIELSTLSSQKSAEMAREVLDIQNSLDEIMEITRDSLLRVRDSNERVQCVSSNITGVVDKVRDISDRINLLSLNASIEAARAGDHGRGFAVVATEIGKLSVETQNSVNEISSQIQDAVSSIADSNKHVSDISQAVSGTLHGIENFRDLLVRVAKFAEEDAKRKGDIQYDSTEIKNKASIISKLLQEHTQASIGVSGIMDTINKEALNTAASAEEMEAVAGNLKQKATDLKKAVDSFKVI